MLKRILIALAGILAILAIVVALQPSDFRITRSTTIAAPAKAVFTQVNDFHKWDAWSPWAKLDPNATHTFEGPESGQGTILRWAGNKEVGVGSMTITETKPNESILIQLDFKEPFAVSHMAEFTFKTEGKDTVVTWSMYGKKNFVAKAMGLVMNCDKMVGEMFEKGLANMKSVVETAQAQKPAKKKKKKK